MPLTWKRWIGWERKGPTWVTRCEAFGWNALRCWQRFEKIAPLDPGDFSRVVLEEGELPVGRNRGQAEPGGNREEQGPQL